MVESSESKTLEEVRIEIAMDFWGLPRAEAIEAVRKLNVKLAEEAAKKRITQLRREISDIEELRDLIRVRKERAK